MDEEKQGESSPNGEAPSENGGVYYPPPPVTQIPGSMEKAAEQTAVVVQAGSARPPAPPPPPPPTSPEDQEEEGMLRMSFMEHLEELRSRIIKALIGLVVAFVACIAFADKLWTIISDPAVDALKRLGVNPPELVQITAQEGFMVIWFELPLLCAVFLASPWVVYQVWAFISPGLYKRERRWAMPFILCTAGLFIGGGLFAYFLAFRYGLTFLLGIGMMNHVRPMVSITEYFDLFVNVTLGVGLVFEMPVVIFLLTLLRLASPRFLLRHSRYAILAIVIIAAIVTPTPDAFNMMLVAVPMCLLYFVGVFLGFLVVMRREGQKFPWKPVLRIAIIVLLVAAAIVFVFHYYHLHVIKKWPYVSR
jgi:sec-independent protein translocase protein TatC